MSRVVPTTGTDRQRLATYDEGLFLPNEITTTRNHKRVFMGGHIILNTVYQGTVLNEAAMLALDETSERGCFPGDTCFRNDTDSEWVCLTNRGELLTDWYDRAATVTGIDLLYGGDVSSLPTDIRYGGDVTNFPRNVTYGGTVGGSTYGGTI